MMAPDATPSRAAAPARGFTLLEVIVALVILSSSGLMIFGWINQNLATAVRLREAQARAQIQLEGVSWLATVNPALEPEGTRELGALRLTWRSELIEPERAEFDFGGNLVPRWMLGLYRLRATVVRTDGAVRADWEQVSAGWRPLRAGAARQP